MKQYILHWSFIEIANEEGHKILKKAEITVKQGLVKDGDDNMDI